MTQIMHRWLPHAAFAVAAFGAPLLLSGNRYFAFIAGITRPEDDFALTPAP